MNAELDTTVDARNPWLGLASFTEATRAYFFGRDEEVADLARRVQRKLLTVLFGQSGLGKTSILRAGLVPKLRSQGYCPVYVRIDYSASAPEPADQIKQAIAQTARGSGEWTQVGVAAAGESLWEFLHHRDDVLKDESGRTLTPLVIFDQFEEIFTLAQNDDAGRARAARFIADLGDLVENRPPHSLEAKLEADESAAERFDFARSDYRVLIALREDYLAPLESLKRSMPSIAQNRLRLAPMTGRQALAAVMEPGRELVNEEVASAIVRFVAGGAELQNAEVEPALLSLACRELNDGRIAAGRSEISPDLLEGSQATILINFYERSLADQPASVRRVIEDQLLTASGFRENIAEERLLAAFKSAGSAPETLTVLVNRRLLRVEERLDFRRVELTHDVLCGVVKSSRDKRQEHEAREASARLLAEQRSKELAARQALKRARRVAAGCGLLALVAMIAAVWAVSSTNRAKRAEAATQQARVQSEALVSYLSDDFATALETYGQLSTISEMARQQIAYFRGLPLNLKSIESIRNGALAMITYARAEDGLGHRQGAAGSAREAVALLEAARQQGDRAEASTIALARAYAALAAIMFENEDPATIVTATRARDLIEPIASASNATATARKAYASILTRFGAAQRLSDSDLESAVLAVRKARAIAATFGGREVQSIEAGAMYVDATSLEANLLMRLGREDEALDLDVEGDRIARIVLEKRPEYFGALQTEQLITGDLANLKYSHLDPEEAIRYAKRSRDISQGIVKRDPDNEVAITNYGVIFFWLGDFSWAKGSVTDSFDYDQRGHELYSRSKKGGAWYVLNELAAAGTRGQRRADAGNDEAARAIGAEVVQATADLEKTEPSGSLVPVFARCALHLTQAQISLGLGDFRNVKMHADEAQRLVHDVEPDAPVEGIIKLGCEFDAAVAQGEAELWLGESSAAQRTLEIGVAARDKYPPGTLDQTRSTSMAKVLEALALIRLGREAEARSLIEPEIKFQRDLAGRNKGDATQHLDCAVTLYVDSLIDASHRAALRRESLGQIQKLPPEFLKLRSATRWKQLIDSRTG